MTVCINPKPQTLNGFGVSYHKVREALSELHGEDQGPALLEGSWVEEPSKENPQAHTDLGFRVSGFI